MRRCPQPSPSGPTIHALLTAPIHHQVGWTRFPRPRTHQLARSGREHRRGRVLVAGKGPGRDPRRAGPVEPPADGPGDHQDLWRHLVNGARGLHRAWEATCEDAGYFWPPDTPDDLRDLWTDPSYLTTTAADLVHQVGMHWFHSADTDPGDKAPTYRGSRDLLASVDRLRTTVSTLADAGIDVSMSMSAIGFPAAAPWGLGNGHQALLRVTPTRGFQAAMLVRSLLHPLALGVETVSWFTFMSSPVDISASWRSQFHTQGLHDDVPERRRHPHPVRRLPPRELVCLSGAWPGCWTPVMTAAARRSRCWRTTGRNPTTGGPQVRPVRADGDPGHLHLAGAGLGPGHSQLPVRLRAVGRPEVAPAGAQRAVLGPRRHGLRAGQPGAQGDPGHAVELLPRLPGARARRLDLGGPGDGRVLGLEPAR